MVSLYNILDVMLHCTLSIPIHKSWKKQITFLRGILPNPDLKSQLEMYQNLHALPQVLGQDGSKQRINIWMQAEHLGC